MSFVSKDFGQILEDMRGRATLITDFEVGSVARTTYESFAYELALLYEKMRLVYLSAFVDTAEGQQLDNVVSVLGIKRGEPDFAVGIVTFTRDPGGAAVVVPLGTLVATPDAPGFPKKVYQTAEAKTLSRDTSTADAKVQALLRGEEQTVAEGTITVMPRPIPGIKSVGNAAAILFTGKRRETDEELRERAKNALISFGKATVVSIENALLSLPRVKDVKVREPFHNAQGKVRFKRASAPADLLISRGTAMTARIGETEKPFETTERVVLLAGVSSIEVAARSTLEGQAGEVPNATGVSWRITSDGLASLGVEAAQPFLLREFGIIEVFVDGPDLADGDELERIRGEVDRVRAAGVLALIKPATPITTDGVFRIALNPALKLSSAEKAQYEGAVRSEIERLLKELKMGEPLVSSKLIKRILSVDGADNLEDFRLETIVERDGAVRRTPFVLSDKKIEIEEFERFHARYLCVASEDKPLPIHIRFKAEGLSSEKLEAVRTDLTGLINGLGVGAPVAKAVVAGRIHSICGDGLDAGSLTLRPEPWCERILFDGENVVVTFVEKPVIGNVFGYGSFLEITGALKLTLPADLTGTDMDGVEVAVGTAVGQYLDNLRSEADVVFDDLRAVAKRADRRVLAVDLNWHDFRAALNDIEQPARVTGKKIEVAPLERARAAYVFVTGRTASLRITIRNVAVKVLVPTGGTPPSVAAVLELKNALKNRINNYFTDGAPGRNIVYAEFRGAIEGLLPGMSYGVTELSFAAVSRDLRTQQTSLATAKDIHVRSVELPVVDPITADAVNVTTQIG